MSIESVGLALVPISIIIYIICLMLHGGQHFTFRCCIRSKNYINHSNQKNGISKRHSLRVHSDNIMRQIKRNESICRSCMVGIEDNFDFFPMSFLLYILFIIILSIIILFKYIISNNIISYNISTNNHNYISIIDWLIVHSLIFLSIWESLFNFHRFYTTYFASKKMTLLSSKEIIFKFSIFVIPYVALFLLQIHLWYYFNIFVILLYLIFNVINVWLFGHILIVQYRFVMGTEKYLTNIHDDMLESVYLMRKISLISCISSSIYITLFTVFYNINIILFIPILWSISCICLTLNFVRNRQYIHAKYLSFQLWIYAISLTNCFSCNKSNIRRQQSTLNKTPSVQPHILQSPRSTNTVTMTNEQKNKIIEQKNNILKNINDNTTHTTHTTHTNHSNINNTIQLQNNTVNHHKTQPLPTQLMLNDIEFKPHNPTEENERGDHTPTLIMPANKPVLDTKNSTSSSNKVKWWNRIGTPLSLNKQEQPKEYETSPINSQISPNKTYDMGSQNTFTAGSTTIIRKVSESSTFSDTRKRNQSKSKAMKLLGGGFGTPGSMKSMPSKKANQNENAYAMPTVSTPIPSLFSHLWDNKPQTQFPSKRPEILYEDEEQNNDSININMNGIEIVTENENGNDIMEERDEFNEEEMLEMTNKFEKSNNLIRVSAKHPQLLLQRISTNIDIPKDIGVNTPNKHAKMGNKLQTPSVSRSGSRSPFRKKSDDKQVSLLTEQDHDISPIKDDSDKPTLEQINDLRVSVTNTEIIDIYNTSESEDEPQVMNLPAHFQPNINQTNDDNNKHTIALNDLVGEHVQSLSEMNGVNDHKKESEPQQTPTKTSRFAALLMKIPSPRSVKKKKKMVTFEPTDIYKKNDKNKNDKNKNKRLRSKSDAKNLDENQNAKHFQATKSMTNVDGIIDDNPDVVSMFDVLAKHGFYSQQNVASARQWSDYHKKR
eukprot:485665_1